MSSFNSNAQLSSFNDAFINILELFGTNVVAGIDYLLRKISNIKWSSTVNRVQSQPHKKKSKGVKSGDQGGHSVDPLQPIHCLIEIFVEPVN